MKFETPVKDAPDVRASITGVAVDRARIELQGRDGAAGAFTEIITTEEARALHKSLGAYLGAPSGLTRHGREFFITNERHDAGEVGFPLSALSNAVQLFDMLQPGERTSLAAIATAFNCQAGLIADAVRDHHWMALETADGRLIDGLDEQSGRYCLPTAIDDYSAVFIYHEGE